MVNEEILASLKLAVEHGKSFEDSISALINAGYNEEDIKEAAREINPEYEKPDKIIFKKLPILTESTEKKVKEKRPGKFLIPIFSSLLIFLILTLVFMFLFKKNVINFFTTLS